jgi:hypothetical protein
VAGNRSNIGAGKPHTNADWSYWANNWFEGVSVYEVTLPRRDETYVAEVHGCCRMQDMCRNDENCRANMVSYVAAEPPIPNYRDSVGIWSNYDTHFHLTATIRLDRDPPPVFYLPHFVPFIWSENGELQDLELPVLDFMASRGYVSQQVGEIAKSLSLPRTWPTPCAESLPPPSPFTAQTPTMALLQAWHQDNWTLPPPESEIPGIIPLPARCTRRTQNSGRIWWYGKARSVRGLLRERRASQQRGGQGGGCFRRLFREVSTSRIWRSSRRCCR